MLARSGAKRVMHHIAPPELERSIYTWVASILFLAVCAQWQPVPGVIYELTGPWRLLAWTVQAAGILLTVRASAALDVLDLAGVRPSRQARARPRGRTSARPSPSTLAACTGSSATRCTSPGRCSCSAHRSMTGTRAAFAIISTGYLMMAIPWEERGLVATFGQEYQAYRRKVKTRMIPWVY